MADQLSRSDGGLKVSEQRKLNFMKALARAAGLPESEAWQFKEAAERWATGIEGYAKRRAEEIAAEVKSVSPATSG